MWNKIHERLRWCFSLSTSHSSVAVKCIRTSDEVSSLQSSKEVSHQPNATRAALVLSYQVKCLRRFANIVQCPRSSQQAAAQEYNPALSKFPKSPHKHKSLWDSTSLHWHDVNGHSMRINYGSCSFHDVTLLLPYMEWNRIPQMPHCITQLLRVCSQERSETLHTCTIQQDLDRHWVIFLM